MSTAPVRGPQAETGYTFAEVLVGVTILGFVAASLYSAFSAGLGVIQATRENLRATQILVQKTEAIRLLAEIATTGTTEAATI